MTLYTRWLASDGDDGYVNRTVNGDLSSGTIAWWPLTKIACIAPWKTSGPTVESLVTDGPVFHAAGPHGTAVPEEVPP